MTVRLLTGDCRELLASLEPESADSCVTDPPYHLTSIVKRFGNSAESHLDVATHKDMNKVKAPQYKRLAKGFMGQRWDGGDVAFQRATWESVFRVLKPGAHLVAFSGTRTYHRMVCAIEDAGFEIRDQLGWLFGSGFPKSHDVSKGVDKMLGAERGKAERVRSDGKATGTAGGWKNSGCDVSLVSGPPITPEAEHWQGWGTALKPAWEPICLARKPLIGTVAANVLQHGTGAINVDGCRIEASDNTTKAERHAGTRSRENYRTGTTGATIPTDLGRWPANIIHDGSEEVLAGFPQTSSGELLPHHKKSGVGLAGSETFAIRDRTGEPGAFGGDSGSAARFFYCAKATSAERGEANNHPTVKPIDLMRWLVRLVTPRGGLVLDPFAGSGSTLIAADREQFDAIGMELSEEYAAIATRRLADDRGPLFAAA